MKTSSLFGADAGDGEVPWNWNVFDSKPDNKILLALYLGALVFVALPIFRDFLDIASGIWEKPSTVPSNSRKIEKLYKVKHWLHVSI